MFYPLPKSLGRSANVAVSTLTAKKIDNIADVVGWQNILSTGAEHLARGKATYRLALGHNVASDTMNPILEI